MNLAEFRRRVAGIVGLDTTSTGIELTLTDAWVNEAVVQFLKDTKAHKRLFTVDMTADETEYTLDTDFMSVEKLWVEPADGSQSRMLEPLDTDSLLHLRNVASDTGSGPMWYSTEGAHLLLVYPAPASSSDKLKGLYVPRPAAMSVTSDTPSATANGGIPEEFHPVLLDYVLWKAADFDDDQSSQVGLQYQAQYERGVQKARSQLNKKAGIFRAPASVGRRRRRFPATPGTDWRYWGG